MRLERHGLRVPDDLPVLGVMSVLIGPGGRPFTDEQAVAIRAREGSLLLEANAGSGKTSVLVERFVRSVIEDGVRPPRILAITFTERAAGELRARVRERFVELGRRDEARETETAWVSTIHGFCARVLRAHAIAAGLDPAFSVLDEAAARTLRDQAWDRALAGWLDGEHGAAALDIVAAYDTDRLRTMIAQGPRRAAQRRLDAPGAAARAGRGRARRAARGARGGGGGGRRASSRWRAPASAWGRRARRSRAASSCCADAPAPAAPGPRPRPRCPARRRRRRPVPRTSAAPPRSAPRSRSCASARPPTR